MINTTPTPDTPRIFRVAIRRADGRRRWKLVKCPFYAKDPAASYFGLQAKLAELTLGGHLIGHSTSIPVSIDARARERLVRWPEALGTMLS